MKIVSNTCIKKWQILKLYYQSKKTHRWSLIKTLRKFVKKHGGIWLLQGLGLASGVVVNNSK